MASIHHLAAPPISIDKQAPGLWLWRGDASLSPPLPTSPAQKGLGRIIFPARRGRWRALSGGLALAVLAASVMLHSTPLEELASPGIPAAALQPVPSTTVDQRRNSGQPRRHPIGKGANGNSAARQDEGATDRTAKGEKAGASQIAAKKNRRIFGVQRA